MEEILGLFQSVGISITSHDIKAIFEAADDVIIKQNQLSLSDFQKLMLDDAPKKKFKEYIMERREKFKY
jgi:hypothetical protein